MKGNDGRAARKMLLKRVATVVSFFLLFIGTLHMTGYRSKGDQQEEKYLEPPTNLRKKAQLSGRNLDSPSPKKISLLDDEVLEILSASLNLVDLHFSPGDVQMSPPDSYSGVYGEFCQLNFEVHKNNPASVPMFRDLVAASPECARVRYKIDLRDIATLAREHDASVQKVGNASPKPLELKAAVFHESRCGSTLVANSLIGMDPVRHRVYSESAPPLRALTMCGPPNYDVCTVEQAAELLRDVVYLMGRTNDVREERLFFKIQSAGTRGLRVFQKAFPTTPWLFVYRDPVQVMMSHLKQGAKYANCVKSRKHPNPTAKDIIKRHGYRYATDLSPTMFCAVHLATICEVALEEMDRTDNGIPVNYDYLPDILHTHILPLQLDVPVGEKETARIKQISSVYSKGRDDRAGEWHEDSEQKEQEASSEVKLAASTFLQHSYDELQKRVANQLKEL